MGGPAESSRSHRGLVNQSQSSDGRFIGYLKAARGDKVKCVSEEETQKILVDVSSWTELQQFNYIRNSVSSWHDFRTVPVRWSGQPVSTSVSLRFEVSLRAKHWIPGCSTQPGYIYKVVSGKNVRKIKYVDQSMVHSWEKRKYKHLFYPQEAIRCVTSGVNDVLRICVLLHAGFVFWLGMRRIYL